MDLENENRTEKELHEVDEDQETEKNESYTASFYKRHRTDIAVYVLALSILVGFALQGAIVSDRNKKSEIHYRYYDDSGEQIEYVEEIIPDDNKTLSNSTTRATVSVKFKETKTTTSKVKTTTTKKNKTTGAKNTTVKTRKTTTEVHHTQFPVDINLVTFEQLLEINGVGESVADNILSYRAMVGKIHDMRELLQLNGIGESRLRMLMQYLYVSDDDYIPFESDDNSENTKVTTASTTVPDEIPQYTETTVSSEEITESVPEEPHREQVNINSADAEELMRCLLITQEQADAIIALREQIGYFSAPEELLLTDAFTPSQIEEIRDYLIFDRDF